MNKLVIGLTGNIASGKSEVENIFRKDDIPTLDADKIVKDLLMPGTQIYQQIKDKYKNLYPEIILKKSSHLNKKLLREIIFKDPKQKKFLEDLLHPQVQQVMHKFAKDFLEDKHHIYENAPFCVLSIPLLFNKSKYPDINKILYIDVCENEQIKRLINRDNISEDLAKSMLAAQPDRKTRLSQCDDVIENKGDVSELEKKVLNIIKIYSSQKSTK
jgi:dephospho-CoA kinase